MAFKRLEFDDKSSSRGCNPEANTILLKQCSRVLATHENFRFSRNLKYLIIPGNVIMVMFWWFRGKTESFCKCGAICRNVDMMLMIGFLNSSISRKFESSFQDRKLKLVQPLIIVHKMFKNGYFEHFLAF